MRLQSGAEATEAIDRFFRNTWNAQRTQPPPLTAVAAPAAAPAPDLTHVPLLPHLMHQQQHQQQQMGAGAHAHAVHTPQSARSGVPTGLLTPVNGQPGSPTMLYQQQQQQYEQQGHQAFSSQQHFQQHQQLLKMGYQHQQALAAAGGPSSLPEGALHFPGRHHSTDGSDGAPHRLPPNTHSLL